MVSHADRALTGLRIAAALLIAALAGSCASLSTAQKKDETLLNGLVEIAQNYNSFLQWRDYDKASGFVAPDKKEEFAAALEKVEDHVRIEEIQLVATRLVPVEETTQPKGADPKNPVREGLVTVKLVNITVAPSTQVTTRRLIEKWVFTGGKWLTEMSLLDLLK